MIRTSIDAKADIKSVQKQQLGLTLMSNAVTFGDYRFSRKPLALSRNDKTVPLRNRGLKLLDLLIERRGDLVTHDEIRNALWADRNIDFTRGIHVCVREIRKALEDDAETPRYIETLPRQGYRFIAEVVHPEPEEPTPLARRFAAPFALLALASLFAIVIGAALVAPRLTTGSKRIAEASPAEEPYRMGQYLLETHKADALDSAADYFAEAVGRDSAFAPAYAGLAEVAIARGDFDEARDQLGQATAIEPSFAAAHLHLARIALWQDWNTAAAKQHLEDNLAADAQSARAYMMLAWIAVIEDRPEEARRTANQAYRIDPVSSLRRLGYGLVFYLTRDFRTAIQFCSEGAALADYNEDLYWCIFYAAVKQGQLEKAKEAAIEIMATLELSPESEDRIRNAAPPVAIREFLQTWVAQAETQATENQGLVLAVAEAWAYLGDKEKALTWLEYASEMRLGTLPLFLKDPMYDELRADPRFTAIAEATRTPG